MKNLKTKYMGIEIDNPIILGASDLVTKQVNLRKAEDQGAGAIVYKSLFEEQIQLEKLHFDEKITEFDDIHAEMLTLHPHIDYTGVEEHLLNLRTAKESISIPVIASLNAVNVDTWVEYAKLISQTGVDGIELNFYPNLWDIDRDSSDIENEQIRIVKEIKQCVSIPLSVKLSPDYTNTLNLVKKLDQQGVDSVVLFNSFFQPDIDIKNEKHIKKYNFSNPGDYKKSLRFAGILYQNINADICSSLGIFSGADVIKLILSGASSVQVVSTLYKNGISHIGTMKNELEEWMDEKNYTCLDDFRGKLSKNMLNRNPFIYKRAQYVDLLLNAEDIFGNS